MGFAEGKVMYVMYVPPSAALTFSKRAAVCRLYAQLTMQMVPAVFTSSSFYFLFKCGERDH